MDVRARLLDAVMDPDAGVAERILDRMARLPRREPAPTLEQDVAEIVAAIRGTRHPLLRAVYRRLARHVKG